MTQRNCYECSTPLVSPTKSMIMRHFVPLCETTNASAVTAEMLTVRLSRVCPECLEECVEHLLAMPEEDFEPMLAHYEECLSNC